MTQDAADKILGSFRRVLGESRAADTRSPTFGQAQVSTPTRRGGRKPMPPRQVFSAIVYVLRTGCQWKALPKEFGSASAIHLHFQQWHRAGFFVGLWRAGLAEYDEMEGIAWDWQSVDGAMAKAPLALECAGANPTDRGKKRAQAKFVGRRAWRPAVARRERGQRA
jgi:transposase